MNRVDTNVLIAGGGLAAQRCCESLRRLGHEGRITILCEERARPYDRPPLSKGFITSPAESRELAFRPADWYADHEVELLLGTEACELDPTRRTVLVRRADGDGRAGRLRYGQLVIATGSRPRGLAMLPIGGIVHELRTRPDAFALREALAARRGPLAVVGAGLVGMEIASSARALGLDVVLIEATPTPLGRALPPQLGRWIAGFHREHGIDVRLATTVGHVTLSADRARLELSDGTTVHAGTVLVAAGTVPATEWLASSGLGPGSIPTDAGGRTRHPGVFAAGDVACFPDPLLGVSVPTQHWEAAVRQGVAVARSLVGLAPAEPVPPMFWSDQHGRRIQFVGHAPRGCAIELEGDPQPDEAFVARVTADGHPAGALLVDRTDAVPGVRQWIAAPHAGIDEERRAA